MHKHKKAIIIVGIFLLIVFGKVILTALKYSPVFFQLVFNKQVELKKSSGNINILLLGIGGGTHDGPLLTDTIIYASIDPVSNKATLISIPRDLWVPDLKAKINTTYAIGEEKKRGGGLLLAKVAVEKILSQPVDYILRIDFNGFVKAVDLVGGIDVNVEKSFEDLEYPISGKENDPCGFTGSEFDIRAASSSAIAEAFPCRYEQLSFQQGKEHMDGERALKFVRSRHAIGSEGTDFARARRQEIVIEAFRNKIFSINILLNPGKLMDLYGVFRDSIHTNIQQNEYDDFVKLALKMKNAKTNSVVFFYSDPYSEKQGIFINPPTSAVYDNQWVLIPKAGNGNFSEVQKYVECEIKVVNCPN